MKKIFHKKIIALLLLFCLVTPKQTHALPVSIVADPQGIMDVVKEYGLDSLATSLLNMMAQKIANKVFNKANGGASGDSSQESYIKNFNDYFKNIQLGQIDKFVTDLSISNSPFATDIAQSLIKNVQSGSSDLESFNLDKVIGSDWKNFTNDAKVGGWDGILALSNPANTNIGSALIAKTELSSRIQTELENEKVKLTTPGTKPQGKCSMDFMGYKDKINGIKEGRAAYKFIDDAFSQGATFYNDDGSTMTDQQVMDASAQLKTDNINNSIGLAEDYGQCLDELINNPVAFVTSTITSNLDSVAQKLSAGDEIGEMIVGALLQMANTFIKTGLSSLQADFKPSKDRVGGPEQLVAANGQNIPWTQVPATIVEMPTEFEQAVVSTEAEVSNLKKYIEAVTSADDRGSFVSAITDLDQCVPGPDYGYKKRLAAYVSKKTKPFSKGKDKGGNEWKIRKNNNWDNIQTSLDSAKSYLDVVSMTPSRNIPGAGIMQSNIASINQISKKYSETRNELVKKQLALNMLYTIENNLQANIQTLRPVLKNLPPVIPFTTGRWNKMATDAQRSADQLSTEQKDLVTWAREIIKLPATIPLTTADWNTLTTTQKNDAVTWAKKITEKTGTVTDKDFVLGTVWYYANIDATAKSTSVDIKRDLVIQTVWKVWTNPENYMATPWDPEGPDAERFLRGKGGKNEIRSDFNSLQNLISIPYSAQQSETNLREISTIILETKNLTDDCNLLRRLADENRALSTDPDANRKFATVLQSKINLFKSKNMQDGIKYPDGTILSQPNTFPDHMTCGTANCYDGSDLVAGDFGLDENVTVEPVIPDIILKVFTGYQQPPAKNIWELLDQKNAAFCGFNNYLKMWTNLPDWGTSESNIGNLINGAGRNSLECSTDWTDVTRSDIRAIIFADPEGQSL